MYTAAMLPAYRQTYQEILGKNAPEVDYVNDEIKMQIYTRGDLGYTEHDVGVVSFKIQEHGRAYGETVEVLVNKNRLQVLAKDAFYGIGMFRALDLDDGSHLRSIVQRKGMHFGKAVGELGKSTTTIYAISDAPRRIFLNQDDLYTYAGYLMLGDNFYSFLLDQHKSGADTVVSLAQLGRRYFHV